MAGMTDAGPLPFDQAGFDAAAIQAAINLGEGLARTVCIARLLVENDRTVDMAGLDRGVGLFCAKALDLPPELGRRVRPHLLALLAETDQLTEALRGQAAR